MSTEIAKPQNLGLAEVPDYLKEIADEDKGLSKLQQYVSPPFIKVVQSNSKAPFNEYAAGTVFSVPLNQELFAPRQLFHITPIFFYPEYVLTNPYALNSLPFIRERSLDPMGELAEKCRDFANREVVCPEAPADKQQNDKYKCCYYEHMNFLCVVHEIEELQFSPIVFTFRSSEFKTGKKLATRIASSDNPICARVYAAQTSLHDSSGNKNWGFDFSNPNPAETGVGPWLPQDVFDKYFALHKKFAELHDKNLLQVNYEDDTAEKDATADAPDM